LDADAGTAEVKRGTPPYVYAKGPKGYLYFVHGGVCQIAALPGMTADHVRSITGHSAGAMVRLYAGKAMQRARAKEAQENRR